MKESKSNRRIYLKFALIIAASLIIGLILGIGIAWGEDTLAPMLTPALAKLGAGLARALPAIGWVGHILALLAALTLFFRCKALARGWDGEDEAYIDAVEQKLNVPLTIANVDMVLNFLYFTLLCAADPLIDSPILFPIGLAAFVFGLIACLAISALTVNEEKRLNPEKRGNVMDTKFHQQWMASCDEAERQTIYKAGFAAYKATASACMILWILTLLGQLAGLMNAWPGICVAALWLVLIISYTAACVRLSKAPTDQM